MTKALLLTWLTSLAGIGLGVILRRNNRPIQAALSDAGALVSIALLCALVIAVGADVLILCLWFGLGGISSIAVFMSKRFGR
jgi:hypothetical protein